MDLACYKIREKRGKKNKVEINEIIELVDKQLEFCPELDNDLFDDITEQQIIYNENFLKKEIEMIADYYEISKRKKTKLELIQDVVLFENDPTNLEITQKRKLMWFYLNELKSDRYLKKFIISK